MSKPVSKAHTLTHRHFMDLNLLLDAAALDAMRTGDAGGRGGAGGAGGAAGAAPGAAEAVFLRRFAVQFMGGRQVQSPRDRAALESFTAKPKQLRDGPTGTIVVSSNGIKLSLAGQRDATFGMHRILYSACHQNGAYMSFVVRDKASGKFIAYTLRCDSTEVSADLNETLGKAFELAYKQREDHLAAVSLDACEGVGRFLLSVRLAPLMCTIKGGSAAQLGSVRFELTSRSSGLVGGRSGVVDPNKAMEAIEAGFNEKGWQTPTKGSHVDLLQLASGAPAQSQAAATRMRTASVQQQRQPQQQPRPLAADGAAARPARSMSSAAVSPVRPMRSQSSAAAVAPGLAATGSAVPGGMLTEAVIRAIGQVEGQAPPQAPPRARASTGVAATLNSTSSEMPVPPPRRAVPRRGGGAADASPPPAQTLFRASIVQHQSSTMASALAELEEDLLAADVEPQDVLATAVVTSTVTTSTTITATTIEVERRRRTSTSGNGDSRRGRRSRTASEAQGNDDNNNSSSEDDGDEVSLADTVEEVAEDAEDDAQNGGAGNESLAVEFTPARVVHSDQQSLAPSSALDNGSLFDAESAAAVDLDTADGTQPSSTVAAAIAPSTPLTGLSGRPDSISNAANLHTPAPPHFLEQLPQVASADLLPADLPRTELPPVMETVETVSATATIEPRLQVPSANTISISAPPTAATASETLGIKREWSALQLDRAGLVNVADIRPGLRGFGLQVKLLRWVCALEDEDGNTFVSCWHAADNTGGVHILIPAHIQRAAPLTTDLVVQLDGCRLEMAMGRMHVLPTRYALLAVDGTAHATLSKLLLASVPHCISDDVCVPWAPRLLR